MPARAELMVQVADVPPEAVVIFVAEQRPVQFAVVVPFGPLAEFAPMNSSFLPGMVYW